MSADEISQPRSLQIHDELREAILAGKLEPGTRLRAEALGERLRVSRTPVREALVLLAREGLVEIEPRRGASVRSFDAADLMDLYEVRALIEPHAAARAATRIGTEALKRLHELCVMAEARSASDGESVAAQLTLNDEFHGIILEAADSPRLAAAMKALVGIPHVFRANFWRDDDQRTQSLFCHRELASALSMRRADLAETLMRMHIQGAGAFLSEVMDGRR
jgi:DNA-binding GntR family transcriptional regulator